SGPADAASGVCGNVRGIRSGLPSLSQNWKRPSPADGPRLIASSVNFQYASEVACGNDAILEKLGIKLLACSTVNGRPATVMAPERAAPGLACAKKVSVPLPLPLPLPLIEIQKGIPDTFHEQPGLVLMAMLPPSPNDDNA